MHILAYTLIGLGLVHILVLRAALVLHALRKRLEAAEAKPDWKWHVARVCTGLILILVGLWCMGVDSQ